MRVHLAIGLAALLLAQSAVAQLVPYRDYTVSDAVWNVTTVKVHANMIDDYLEGIEKTWIASNEVAKKLGQIEEYAVYVSDLPNSGDFNVLLVTKVKNTADMAPSQERFDAFMKEWGESNVQQSRTISKDYPSMRDITGEYMVREVTFK